MIIASEKDRILAIEKIKELDLKKGKWSQKLKKLRSRRSLDQNRLLWLWMTALEIDSEYGYTKEEFKDMFQKEFCPRTEMWINGKRYEVIKGTSQLDTKEFTDFLDRTQLFCYHELHFSLPQPSDYWFEQFREQYENEI